MVEVNVSLPEPTGPPPQQPSNLTDLGRRTLSGYRLKWGPIDGLEKFNEAMERGHITRAKMVGGKADRPGKAKAGTSKPKGER